MGIPEHCQLFKWLEKMAEEVRSHMSQSMQTLLTAPIAVLMISHAILYLNIESTIYKED